MKVIDQEFGNDWVVYHGDCVEVVKSLPTDSLHYSIFSPPFASLFTYSDSERDMGNCKNHEFAIHFKDFLAPELFRALMPGRLISFHCSDIPAMKERDGYIGLKDFPGDLIRMFESVGFIYYGKHIIQKDPLLEATRTKAIGLMHKQIVKDSTVCRAGLPDYLVTMKKPGINPELVSHPMGFEKYIGERDEPTAPKRKVQKINKYSHIVWQRYANPIWTDINQTNTLNVRLAREKNDERHICPLQLDVIERALELYTNTGDIVLSPFAGIGSEGYVALKAGRKFIGVELKKSYYDQAVKYMQQIETAPKQQALFN